MIFNLPSDKYTVIEKECSNCGTIVKKLIRNSDGIPDKIFCDRLCFVEDQLNSYLNRVDECNFKYVISDNEIRYNVHQCLCPPRERDEFCKYPYNRQKYG